MGFRSVIALVLCENRLVGKPLLLCLLAVGPIFAADPAPLSIERYLNAPFASGLVTAPGGGRVAWILNERGARNIWVAAAPDYKGRRLTAFLEQAGEVKPRRHHGKATVGLARPLVLGPVPIELHAVLIGVAQV